MSQVFKGPNAFRPKSEMIRPKKLKAGSKATKPKSLKDPKPSKQGLKAVPSTFYLDLFHSKSPFRSDYSGRKNVKKWFQPLCKQYNFFQF